MLKEFADRQKNADEYRHQINERLDEVFVKGILAFFKSNHVWYDYDNGSGEIDGYFDPVEYVNYIGIVGEYDNRWEMEIIDKFGDEINLGDGFPTRWLEEDFQEELEQGRRRFLEQELAKKEKSASYSSSRKERRLALCKQVKEKLTKEEIKFIVTQFSNAEKKALIGS